MVLLWCRGLQLCVRYWSAPTRLHPCGRWLLTRAVCGRPVQLSSNSMMSDIDSESADFFNDSPNFFVKKWRRKEEKIKNWKKARSLVNLIEWKQNHEREPQISIERTWSQYIFWASNSHTWLALCLKGKIPRFWSFQQTFDTIELITEWV